MSVAAFANWLVCFGVVTLLPMLHMKFPGDLSYGLILLLVLCVVALLFNYSYIVETKNKSLNQIVKALSRLHLSPMLCKGDSSE